MATDPPQFFANQNPEMSQPHVPRVDHAIYQIKTGSGKPVTIAIACVEGGGNVPRNATSFLDVANKLDLDKEFASVSAVASAMLEKMKTLQPGEVEIEFGVEVGGSLCVPLITSGQAKANFKIKLKWKND
ncbi:MAG: hypothetical protein K2Y31_00470 [Burkholderiales bacterium]|jgi:hypothetical protein|nr:hypothetical protein [Burkholderiales bacterium]